MNARFVTSDVSLMGAVDWDRKLFDALIPLPEGTTYNAYLVRGSEKTALVDGADPVKLDVLMAQLDAVDHLDYLVAQHAEQDHSGSIPAVLARYPEAVVVTNAKAKELLQELLGIPADRFRIVADGETLSLGGKTLRFIYLHGCTGPRRWAHTLRKSIYCFHATSSGHTVPSLGYLRRRIS